MQVDFETACRILLRMASTRSGRAVYFHHTVATTGVISGLGPIIKGADGLPRLVTWEGQRWATTVLAARRCREQAKAELHIQLRPEPRRSWSNRILAPLRAFWRVLTK